MPLSCYPLGQSEESCHKSAFLPKKNAAQPSLKADFSTLFSSLTSISENITITKPPSATQNDSDSEEKTEPGRLDFSLENSRPEIGWQWHCPWGKNLSRTAFPWRCFPGSLDTMVLVENIRWLWTLACYFVSSGPRAESEIKLGGLQYVHAARQAFVFACISNHVM